MNENISNFLKGIFIGFANIIPGVSGGTIAVITGIYNKCINSISTIFSSKKNKKEAIIFILPVIIGAGLGLVLFSNVVYFFIDKFEEQTFLFFMGLVFGTVPFLYKKATEIKKLKFNNFLIMIIIIIVFCALSYVSVSKERVSSVLVILDVKNYLKFILIGFVTISAMIIPGISGSFLLLILGYYSTFIYSIKTFNIPVLLFFFIGGAIAFLVTIKVINYIIKNHYTMFYTIVLGLVIGSNLMIFPQFSPGVFGFLSNMFFIVGFVLAYTLSDKNNIKKSLKQSLKLSLLPLVFGLLILFFTKPKKQDNYFYNKIKKENEFLVLAHSIDEVPKGTPIAFEHTKNIEENIILEMDVYFTSDNKIVVFHDNSLKKVLGVDKKIEDISYKELSKIVKEKNLKTKDKTPIYYAPKLEEVLKEFNKIPMLIEIKNKKETIIRKFLDLLKKYNKLETTIISSKDTNTIKKVRQLEKKAITSASSDEIVKYYILNILGLSVFYKANFDFLIIPDRNLHLQVLNPNFINSINKKNIPLIVYTINDENKLKKYINYGISGIITDKPTLLKDILKNKKR